MSTPLTQFYYYLSMLCQTEEALKLLKPYNVTSFKHLGTEHQEEVVGKLKDEWSQRSKRPRGAVIHYLCIMPGYDYKTVTGDPNYEKIDDFVKGIGANNPNKRELNKLNLSELNKVVGQVKAMYRKQLSLKK
jgi:hypothetical protein